MKKLVRITKDSGIPLVGAIAFGVIDRGTDLLQVRPTTVCNLNCVYCSTDSGPFSQTHAADYEVELSYLLECVKDAAEHKGVSVEINIDSIGEPLAYKDIAKLVEGVAGMKDVRRISMQTNGTLLTEKLLGQLEKAGLSQINLSINTLDPVQARQLSGTQGYDLDRVVGMARKIAKSKMTLLLAPVWIPKLNDKGIEDLIELSKELGCRIGIQKYETYKHSRKVPKAKALNYWKFYKQIDAWEKEHDTKLRLTAKDFSIKPAKRIPEKFKKGDKDYVEIKALGWMKGQMLGVARNRAIMVNNCKAEIGNKVRIKILETKNNIYVAEPL